MKEIIHSLSRKLRNQGFMGVEISRLIRDVFHITAENERISVANANRKLERLGWKSHALNESTFELIRFLNENRSFNEFDMNSNF